MFTVYNTTLLAVMQVGVMVAGILASGLWHKFFATDNHLSVPWPAAVLYQFGLLGFLIPVVWLVSALLLRHSAVVSDGVKRLAFGLGILTLIALAAFVLYADISPVFKIRWRLNGDDPAA